MSAYDGGYLGGDLVTGEAVLLEVRLAKLPSRAVAELLDVIVQLVLLFAGSYVLGQVMSTGDSDVETVVGLVLVVAVIVGYPLLFETLTRGRSPGKMAMGLRVVRDDGGAERFRHALARALVGVIEIWATFGVIAILTSLVSQRGKRVGDYVAGTVVVRERVPTSVAPMITMPPMLAAWAATLDLSRLPDPLALSARQFLARVGDLTAQARHDMGSRLAYDVARFVSPPPPTGCPPEPYLAAVLAARRRREELRYAAAAPAPVRQAPVAWPAQAPAPPSPYAAAPPAAPSAGPPTVPPPPSDPDGFHPPA